MKSSAPSCVATPDQAHLMINRDRQPHVIFVKDGLIVEAVLTHGAVKLSFISPYGIESGAGLLDFEAFDEILDMIIHFGRA